MITSVGLASTAFISSTDATRLQMAAKQLSQTVTHLNCKRPYVIGSDYYTLVNSSRLFRAQAKSDGSIIYINSELMIVIYDETEELKIYEIPEYNHTSYGFATRLRFKREIGDFKKNDILYEYDCFSDGIPSFGYNMNVAFFPFFSHNFEDSIVISESASNLLRSQKIEDIIIPIYTYSLFKNIYDDSKHGFIPEIKQSIKDNVVAISASPKGFNKKSTLRSFNIYDFSSVINNSINFNTNHIVSKIYNAKIESIKIHQIGKSPVLIDKQLQQKIEVLKNDYFREIKIIAKDIASLFGQEYTQKILKNYYVVQNPKHVLNDTQLTDLAYIIELKLVKDKKTEIGDKLSNRYAGKGTVGLIIPDELRPYNAHTKEPIDIILGPLSVFSRQNFGQVLEGLIAKTIHHCEKEILKHRNANHSHEILIKLSNISKILKNDSYAKEIVELSNNIKRDHKLFQSFIDSIINGGLYFEVPNFCSTNVYELQQYIKENIDISTNDAIVLKKELFESMSKLIKLNIELPESDITFKNIFNSPMYILKLKQLADSKCSVRDVGQYSQASKQPVEDIYGQNKGNHIGSMEFDALIAHNNIYTMKEFYTVKSDSLDMKENLIAQILTNGRYEMPEHKSKSYTKMIIDSLMIFLSNN